MKMNVKEFLEILNSNKDVLITRNGVLIALQSPEYLLNVCKDRTWGNEEIKEIKERTDDILVILK